MKTAVRHRGGPSLHFGLRRYRLTNIVKFLLRAQLRSTTDVAMKGTSGTAVKVFMQKSTLLSRTAANKSHDLRPAEVAFYITYVH